MRFTLDRNWFEIYIKRCRIWSNYRRAWLLRWNHNRFGTLIDFVESKTFAVKKTTTVKTGYEECRPLEKPKTCTTRTSSFIPFTAELLKLPLVWHSLYCRLSSGRWNPKVIYSQKSGCRGRRLHEWRYWEALLLVLPTWRITEAAQLQPFILVSEVNIRQWGYLLPLWKHQLSLREKRIISEPEGKTC